MLFAAENQVGLHGRIEGVDVAVRVFSGKDVHASSERLEVSLVIKKPNCELLVAIAGTAPIGEEEILWKGVGLVPIVGDVTFFTRAPRLLTIDGVRRKVR